MDDFKVKDSNMAGIGGERDRAVRKAAAATEPQWEGAGRVPGVQVWRIEKFSVQPWPQKKCGKFHIGDSYIVLHTVQVRRGLARDIYFWLGSESSTDEMGTAAYKTVELCDYFDGRPRQFREVQGEESANFRALFDDISYLPGGIASGFRHIINDCFQPRLFTIRKTKKGVVEVEMTLRRDSLNHGDCFVLDTGRTIYVWHGKSSHPLEKFQANAAAERLESRRGGRAYCTHNLDDTFWNLLGGRGPIKGAAEGTDDIPEVNHGDGILYKFTDESGKLEMFEVARGILSRTMLDSDNVMILDRFQELCVWVGSDASMAETRNALRAAYSFLKTNSRAVDSPIHLFKEGQPIKNSIWNRIFK